MLLPGREWQEGYRFAFNGKEQDPEQLGQGNIYDYGFRIYNPRLGKFLSVDPLTKSFPWWTPYQFAGNQPIWAVDLDGLEIDISTFKKYLNNGKLDWHITNHDFLQKPGPLGDGYLMIKDNEDGTYNYEYSNITDDTYEYYSGQCNVTSLALGFSV